MAFMSVPKPERAAPLTGPIKTRANAREVYRQIVDELRACEDQDTLDTYLMTITEPLQQFEQELDFLWNGDGFDFLGLQGEIRRARRRCAAEW